ncbi:exported hypothetical protein [Hyphomicrobiales bacterium]|nr:exported hypothetical protein [Hyphomicrobiales bacterium]
MRSGGFMRSVLIVIAAASLLSGCVAAKQRQAAAKMQTARSECEAIYTNKYVPMAGAAMTQAYQPRRPITCQTWMGTTTCR